MYRVSFKNDTEIELVTLQFDSKKVAEIVHKELSKTFEVETTFLKVVFKNEEK